MRALLVKNSLVLMAFLCSGLTIFTLLVLNLGFMRAFVTPRFRVPDELLGGWVFWGLAFGWVMGISDEVRGMSDYVAHRGHSKARMFFIEQSVAAIGLLAVLILPWVVLAIAGQGLFEPDYMGIGSRWLSASTLTLPCYGIGIFLSKLPMHIALRLVLTIPMTFWVIGETPDRILEGTMNANPLAYALGNIGLMIALMFGGYLATAAGRDQDLPLPRAAVFPVLLLLIGSGWSLHTLSAASMDEATERVNKCFIATRPDGSYLVAKPIKSKSAKHHEHWEVDPTTNKPTVQNDELVYVDEASWYSTSVLSNAGSTYHIINPKEEGLPHTVRAYLKPGGGPILHLVRLDTFSGAKLTLGKGGDLFSHEARMLGSRELRYRPEVWVGDPSDGSVWFVDFRTNNPSYVQVSLPEDASFEQWMEPSPRTTSLGEETSAARKETWEGTSVAYIKTKAGYFRLLLDSRQVVPLTPAQDDWIAQQNDALEKPKVHTTEPGLLFHKKQVLDADGKSLFTYNFAPRTNEERLTAATATLLSFMQPPILEPKAFGNITHVEQVHRVRSDYGVDPGRDPIRYASMQAISLLRLRWTGYSPWSLVAWFLLLGLAFLQRLHLIRMGATGSRLWLWPAATVAFGPLALVMQCITESKRAFHPMKSTENIKVASLISSPA